ncbi:MAG: hypothetical protein ACP5UV_04665 [Thermoplasmata archaeon]
MDGSIYERELRDILSGKKSTVEKFKNKIDDDDRILDTLYENPFYVVRAAGSFGADLIAIRHDFSLVIEVKSSIKPSIMFAESSGKRQEQAERLKKLCDASGLVLTYAYRLKSVAGDPWRLFSVPGNPKGRLRIIYELLPKIGETRENNFCLKWNDGLPLIEFIKFVNNKI